MAAASPTPLLASYRRELDALRAENEALRAAITARTGAALTPATHDLRHRLATLQVERSQLAVQLADAHRSYAELRALHEEALRALRVAVVAAPPAPVPAPAPAPPVDAPLVSALRREVAAAEEVATRRGREAAELRASLTALIAAPQPSASALAASQWLSSTAALPRAAPSPAGIAGSRAAAASGGNAAQRRRRNQPRHRHQPRRRHH